MSERLKLTTVGRSNPIVNVTESWSAMDRIKDMLREFLNVTVTQAVKVTVDNGTKREFTWSALYFNTNSADIRQHGYKDFTIAQQELLLMCPSPIKIEVVFDGVDQIRPLHITLRNCLVTTTPLVNVTDKYLGAKVPSGKYIPEAFLNASQYKATFEKKELGSLPLVTRPAFLYVPAEYNDETRSLLLYGPANYPYLVESVGEWRSEKTDVNLKLWSLQCALKGEDWTPQVKPDREPIFIAANPLNKRVRLRFVEGSNAMEIGAITARPLLWNDVPLLASDWWRAVSLASYVEGDVFRDKIHNLVYSERNLNLDMVASEGEYRIISLPVKHVNGAYALSAESISFIDAVLEQPQVRDFRSNLTYNGAESSTMRTADGSKVQLTGKDVSIAIKNAYTQAVQGSYINSVGACAAGESSWYDELTLFDELLQRTITTKEGRVRFGSPKDGDLVRVVKDEGFLDDVVFSSEDIGKMYGFAQGLDRQADFKLCETPNFYLVRVLKAGDASDSLAICYDPMSPNSVAVLARPDLESRMQRIINFKVGQTTAGVFGYSLEGFAKKRNQE